MKKFLGVLLVGLLVLGSLAGCVRAEFEVSPIIIMPSQVVAGEQFTVSTEITNVGGAEGTYTATLTVDGNVAETKEVTVGAAATETVSFTCAVEAPGTHSLELNGLSTTVTALKPAEFEVVSLSVPEEVVTGEAATITAVVANVGDIEGSHSIALLIDGAEFEWKYVTLAPGAVGTISFELVKDVAGAYRVQIDGVSETLVVTELPTVGPEKLGEVKYDIEHEITLKNEGPGVSSRVVLRVALLTTREPYQTVLSTDIRPDDYKTTEDEYVNTFTEFEFSGVGVGEEVSVRITYQVAVSQLRYHLGPCEGPIPTRFLEPERWIESDTEEIVALAKQLTRDKLSPCEKARAIYDWIGDNISYTGYIAEDRGALFTLRNRGGDCTEFSYLLIALCRAAGIPARFLEGVNPKSPSPAAETHGWAEVYLAGTGWVPVDPTWGRFKKERDQYFAGMSPDHIIATVGNPAVIAKLHTQLHFFEYHYWWAAEKAELCHAESWQIRRADW